MSAIKKFEDILSWQKARELNKVVGKLIDEGKFKRSYRLIDQIEGSAGSIMTILLKDLKEVATENFCNFCIYLKVLVVNSDLNYTELLTEDILVRMNLACFTTW